MGVTNDVVNQYLSDNEYFADLINATVYAGEQIILKEALQEVNTGLQTISRKSNGKLVSKARIRDIVKKTAVCGKYIVFAVENQDYIDYGMTVRCMEYEVMEYVNQVENLKKLHANEKIKKEEANRNLFLSGIRKEDRLAPVVTIVLYFGKEPWDASRTLYHMLDLPEKCSSIYNFISDYQINLFDYHQQDDFECFQTELREVFSFLKNSQHKDALLQELQKHKERYSSLKQETVQMIETLTNTTLLSKYSAQIQEGEVIDVCRALEELVEDSRKEGEEKGISALILDNLEEGVSEERILGKLQRRFELSAEDSRKYYERFSKNCAWQERLL